MNSRVDGGALRAVLDMDADIVVVGSGPAGAAAAREASLGGARVVVVEEGGVFDPKNFPISAFDSMALLYRDLSSSVTFGSPPLPFIQAKMVGGSSAINGAICWRLPSDVHQEWIAGDGALADALPWEVLEEVTDALEARLGVAPTDSRIAGPKAQLMARGAEALALEHRAIRRNVLECEGLGRCLQGCPRGHKQSVDVTLLADAERAGMTLLTQVKVTHVELERERASAVVGQSVSGSKVRVNARHAVILAASAVQTPVLLLASGLNNGPVGKNFQCHPGVSMVGRFPEPVRMWEGATQGHEVIGLRHEGLKIETLGFGLGILAGRLDGVGRQLSQAIADIAHVADWGVAIRAQAKGRVRRLGGKPFITYQLSPGDVAMFRRGLRIMGEMMLAAGADYVSPGVHGVVERTSKLADLVRLEQDGPKRASAYTGAITHMFSTCRMGSDPKRSVVRPDFRHHQVEGLYIADSSVFPSNIGVNPQIPIMALATLAARRALGLGPEESPASAISSALSNSPANKANEDP